MLRLSGVIVNVANQTVLSRPLCGFYAFAGIGLGRIPSTVPYCWQAVRPCSRAPGGCSTPEPKMLRWRSCYRLCRFDGRSYAPKAPQTAFARDTKVQSVAAVQRHDT
jgi:hypothetical protein